MHNLLPIPVALCALCLGALCCAQNSCCSTQQKQIAHSSCKAGVLCTGLLDMSRAPEWVVTTKLGASNQRPGKAAPLPRVRTCRFYAGEVAMSLFMLTAATYGALVVQRFTFSISLLLQGELENAGELVDAGRQRCMQCDMLHQMSVHRTGHSLFNMCHVFESESCMSSTEVSLPLLCYMCQL